MKRAVLDDIARDYRLDQAAIGVALELTGDRPDAAAWRAFAIRLANAAGIAAVGAGATFFVAANWQHFEVLGRFALVQAAFLAIVGVAWWRPPPHVMGRSALVLATLLTGGLLALFGQTRYASIALNEQRIAFLAKPGAPSPLKLRYRVRNGMAWLGTNAFFFEEGSDRRFATARYGEFRLDPASGEAVLVALRDANLNPL